MANFNKNIQMLGCIRVLMSGSAKNVTLINCSGFTGDASMSGRTYINNGRVLANLWTTLDTSNADASSPYTMTGDVGNKYKVDTSSGDIYAVLDTAALNGETVHFKIIDDTNTLILSTSANTEQILTTSGWQALPFTITPILGENYPISSDGENFYIL